MSVHRAYSYAAGLLRLLRTPTAAQTGIVMSGTLTSAALRLVITFAFAALLEPTQWAELAYFIAMVDMAAVFSDSGIHATTVRFMAQDPDKDPRPVILRCLAVKMAVAAAVCVVAALLYPWAIAVLREDFQARWLYPAAIAGGLLLGFSAFAMSIFQGCQRYGLYAFQAVLINVVRACATAAVVWTGAASLAVFGALYFGAPAAGALAGAVIVLWLLTRRPPAEKASAPYRELLAFIAPLALMQIITISNMRVSSFMIKSLGEEGALGNYELAYQVGFVFPLLTGALFAVLLPKVSAMKERAELRTYRRQALKLYPAVLILTLAGVIVGPLVLTAVFGDKYAPANAVIRVLVLTFGIHVVTQPLTLVFYSIGRPHYLTVIYGCQLAGLIPLNMLLIPRLNALGAAISILLVTVLAVGAIIALSGRVLKDQPYSEGIKSL